MNKINCSCGKSYDLSDIELKMFRNIMGEVEEAIFLRISKLIKGGNDVK